MKQLPLGAGHAPILIRPNDQILWIGDNGEDVQIDKTKMKGVLCDDEDKPDPKAPKDPPITDPVDAGYSGSHKLKLSSARPESKGFCYKHFLHWDKGIFGGHGDIDPHVYIGDGT
ncbi:MAG TPA: hypothetical protein VNX88_17245 [Terriglobales bacterium]|nr:hypothetical protein [Terriglobales bacterium]